jgi:hypothetical protein
MVVAFSTTLMPGFCSLVLDPVSLNVCENSAITEALIKLARLYDSCNDALK